MLCISNRLVLCSLAVTMMASSVSAQQANQRTAATDHAQAAEQQVPDEGVVVLRPTQGEKASGTLMLKQVGDAVHITGKISNLTPGKHGFHIHQYGDLRAPDGSSAGGHYSPEGHDHGAPEDPKHHAGDLGNITADASGVANVDVKSSDFKLHTVLGRAFVVHAQADDLKSQPSGNAGGRIAVGIIGVANTEHAQ